MTRPINPGRLILATILAPFTTVLAVSSVMLHSTSGFLAVALFGSVTVGWPAMLLLGLPLHGLLCSKDKRRWFYYALAGFLAGAIALFVFMLIAEGTGRVHVYLLMIGAASGAVTAVLFHLIRGPHLAEA